MNLRDSEKICEEMKKIHPQKFASEEEIFSHIHRGDRIFISTACGENLKSLDVSAILVINKE